MRTVFLIALLAAAISACTYSDSQRIASANIPSLTVLSIESLRNRQYGSSITIEEQVLSQAHKSYLTSYDSDGLRVYARLDIPGMPMPAGGYPAVLFIHGWVGIGDAPSMDFYYGENSNYGEMIDAYVAAGFVVMTPGWRGHGTVDGVPADGISFMQAWDNGSYLSPAFYAIDVLNLLDSLSSISEIDLDNINLVAHSQGGDVALLTLAAAGEGSKVNNSISAASIWSGNIPSRFTQLETFWPMQTTTEAFMSGDGSWNGTPVGAAGQINEHFVFGYPADWIGTISVEDWSWQNDTWSVADVPDAINVKLQQMYDAINSHVDDIDDASFRLRRSDGPGFSIQHDARVSTAIRNIDAFDKEHYLTEALALHYSDRDFYSFPDWNTDLCGRVNANGGRCFHFEYPENTHSLRVSEHQWFSSDTAVAGFSYAIQRDIAFFRGEDPAETRYP
ncbi:MAG: alpha/beta hydrolase [Gammaproteobacteria bacterium]|nr:alpha/beta hydrolase [Gammaproteobacteria bacterium]